MAAVQLTGSSCVGGRRVAHYAASQYEGLRPAALRLSTPSHYSGSPLPRSPFRGVVVKSATAVAPRYTTVKPIGDRVLIKIKGSEEKTVGGILLPSSVQTKPQSGEVVAVGKGKNIGETKVELSVRAGEQVVYSKYAGIEIEVSGNSHIILKEEDIVGVLETDDIKDLKPLNDRLLIKLAPAEEKTAGGLLLTEATKEKPAIGTIVAVGPGAREEDGSRRALKVKPGSSVLYSKYAGSDFKGTDGTDYVVLRENDVMAVLS